MSNKTKMDWAHFHTLEGVWTERWRKPLSQFTDKTAITVVNNHWYGLSGSMGNYDIAFYKNQPIHEGENVPIYKIDMACLIDTVGSVEYRLIINNQ